jgi:hypothetical protein
MPNQAYTWFHEFLHVNWVSGANPKIKDIDLVLAFQEDDDITYRKTGAYGPRRTKSLARLGEIADYCNYS